MVKEILYSREILGVRRILVIIKRNLSFSKLSKKNLPGSLWIDYNDELDVEDLPWYYPWGGIDFLPEEDDVVSVIVFDKNSSRNTGTPLNFI